MKKELFSIPNLIGYFRILMLPVFLYKYYSAKTFEEYMITFVLLAIIFLSDAADGFIARKFHMVTDFGKMLDPVADKLVQGSLAIAVMFHHPLMKVFLVVFLCKEVYMSVMGLYLLKKKDSLNGAQWYGKVCTTIVDAGILILLFFPSLPQGFGNGLIVVMIALEIFSAVKYLQFHMSILKESKQKNKNTISRKNR